MAKDGKNWDATEIAKLVKSVSSGKKLDRTKHVEEIFDGFRKLAKNDMRIGQAFENIRVKYGNDLFNVENDVFLQILENFLASSNK